MTQTQKIISTLSLAHAQRLDELIGVGPLVRKPIDAFLVTLGLVEQYDETDAVQLTDRGVTVFESLDWVQLFKQRESPTMDRSMARR